MTFSDKLQEWITPYELKPDDIIRQGDMVVFDDKSIWNINNENWNGLKVEEQIKLYNDKVDEGPYFSDRRIVSILRNR